MAGEVESHMEAAMLVAEAKCNEQEMTVVNYSEQGVENCIEPVVAAAAAAGNYIEQVEKHTRVVAEEMGLVAASKVWEIVAAAEVNALHKVVGIGLGEEVAVTNRDKQVAEARMLVAVMVSYSKVKTAVVVGRI